MGFVAGYVRCLQAHGCKALLFIFCLSLGASYYAMKLSSTTTTSFGASPGTQSYAETEEIKVQFPDVFQDVETALVQCASPATCTCTSPQNCVGFKTIIDGLISGMAEFKKAGTLMSMSSYFDLKGDLVPVLGAIYYNSTANAMSVMLKFDKGNGIGGQHDVTTAVTHALEVCKSLSKDGFAVEMTGQTANTVSATKQIGKIIGMADGTGMIFIVLLFGWQVGSWRLTLIPIVNTLLCLMLAQGLIYPLSISGTITLPSYVPNVCLFLCIALSVDYSFFHLSRFQEVRKQGEPLERAVEEMVTTAGRVVLVSGVVLLFTWLALAAFPVFGTNTLGYCSAITIFCCIVVNLINNPAVILICPNFFGRAPQDPWHCCRCRRRDAVVGEGLFPNGESEHVSTKNCYGSIGRISTSCVGMCLVPLLVYLLLLPGAIRLFSADLVVGGVAGGSASTDSATKHILADFSSSHSGGVPLTVMLSAPVNEKVTTDSFFSAGCELAHALKTETGFLGNDFHGIMLLPSPDIECTTYTKLVPTLKPDSITEWSWKQSVNLANTSVLITVTPPFDAFSNAAKDLIAQARAAVRKFKDEHESYSVACFHPMAIEVDAEALTAGRFPWVICVTVIVVFVLIGVRYKAALVPVKLLFTIALPIVSVLGTGVFVFQDGYLDWTGIPSLKKQGGLVWINPVACSFMLIGFGLDYDIFLFSRIYALRKSGSVLDDREAIVNSVAATGPVITTAGCIMALAFVGMVAQHDNPFLCQMGFTMIFGVLMDTFIVRTLLVPAFLAMAGRFNWWPGKMPDDDNEGNSAKSSRITLVPQSATC